MKMETGFWAKWYKANEIERAKLIDTLPLMWDKKHLFFKSTATLLNGYFEDLALYLDGIHRGKG